MHEQQWQPMLDLAHCKISKVAAVSSRSSDRTKHCSAVEPDADLMEHAGRVKLARSVAQELQGRTGTL